MNSDQLVRALFWTIPFAATVAISVFLLYLSHKDKDKRKIMFMLSFAFASVGYSNLMLQRFGVATLWDKNSMWSFVPIGAAGLIAVISNLVKPKSFDRSFKFFLIALGISILLLIFPSAANTLRIPLLCTFAALSFPASAYMFLKKRDNSDLMFFLAFSCFMFSWISLDVGLAEEITVLLTLFAIVFTALMFSVTNDRIADNMASFFTLQSKLEKTQEDLQQTQKKAFADLQASEERYRNLCENARVGILRMDRKGTVTYANRLINEYGLNRDDVVGKNMLRFIPMKNRPKMFMEHISVVRGNNSEGETEIITPKGKLTIEYISNPVRHDGKIIGCETVMQDVTDKKEMEKKLEEYAARLETMVEARTVELKKSEEKLGLMVGQQASLMRSSAEMIRSSDMRQRLQAIVDAIQGLGWRRVILSVRDEELDISEPQNLVTAGLTEKEQEFIWTNRQSGKIWRERFGPEFERFKLGEFYYLPYSDPLVREKFRRGVVFSHLKPEEMIDWNPDDLLYAPLRLADGRIVAVLSVDDPDDGRRPTKDSLKPLELFLHQAAVAIENAQLIKQLNEANAQIQKHAGQLEERVKERTQELVDAQKKLLQSERLAAIGQIAAMVGHDLRSPLAGIRNAVYILKTRAGPKLDEKEKQMLETIDDSVTRSSNITGDLLDFSREIKLEKQLIDVKAVVQHSLMAAGIPKNIDVKDLIPDSIKLEAAADKIERVFTNIIKNAAESMPKGGLLTIATKTGGENLSISFTDTGVGMPDETLQKLWTPLFTTKPRGIGLGLVICKRFIEAHGGTITVKSTLGKGTTFTITLPAKIQDDKKQETDQLTFMPATEPSQPVHEIRSA